MDTPTPNRRWYQFRLRTLLVFVTVCALPCSWVAVKKAQAKRERQVAAEIEELGGTVEWSKPAGPGWVRFVLGDDCCCSVYGVRFSECRDIDAALDLASGLEQLQSLNLSFSRITDAGLEHLKPLSHLQFLCLSSTKVTDAGMEHLKPLSQLQRLDLIYTQVTDAGLEHLKALRQLRRLTTIDGSFSLSGCKDFQQALPNCEIINQADGGY